MRVLLCSHVSCQRSWSSTEPLALAPVIERRPDGDLHWHPCPGCLDDHGPAAELSHDMRARTARELSTFA